MRVEQVEDRSLRLKNKMLYSLRYTLLLTSFLSVTVQANDGRHVLTRVSANRNVMPASAYAWQKVVTGHLKNGVRFAIMPRHSADAGVGLLLRNEGGFIAERRPGERGLAHLIEHIVFTSPTTGSPNDLDHFKRVGLQITFPAPHVATTSWRESNYFLSSKTKNATDLDKILGLFREAATDLTFRADAVARERTSVMHEMADKNLGNQIYASYIAAVAPGSPTDMIDAQNSDDVPTASIDTIRGLYRRLYRPENTMIVIVGDVNAKQLKALIAKRFADWQPTVPPVARASYPAFDPSHIRPISVSTLPEGRRTALMTVVMPLPRSPTSRTFQARDEIMELLVMRAIDARLSASQPVSPPGKRGVYIEHGEQGHRLIMIWDHFSPDQWKPAVVGLRRTTCDLVNTGFTEGEWLIAQQNVIRDLERRQSDMAKVPNVDLAIDLSHGLADGRAVISPDEMLRHARTMVPQMGAQLGSEWWRQQWLGGTEHLRVEVPELANVAEPETIVGNAANAALSATACKLK